MKKLGLVFVMAAALGCGGGGDDDGGDGGDDGGEPTYADDVRPIFVAKCNFCHHPGSATDLDLTDPFGDEGAVNRRSIAFEMYGDDQEFMIEPGNPDASFLMTKVIGTDLRPDVEGGVMPYVIEPLNDDQVSDVVAWIEAGANDDATFDPVSAILGTNDQTLGGASGKCTLCHYEGSPPPRLNVLDPFGDQGLVGVAATLGGTRVVPGDPDSSVLVQKITGTQEEGEPMPFAPERLTDDEIATLAAWIEAGAQDN